MTIVQPSATTRLFAAVVRRIVRVGDWAFSAWASAPDDEPRMRDIDGAQRLRLAQPRNIRRVIENTFPGEKLAAIYYRTVSVRQSTGNGGSRTITVREYWLTEAQWLKVIARCRTDVAEAILDDMIHVYMLARRGLLPQQQSAVDHALVKVIEQHGTLLAGIVKRLDAMEERRTADRGLIGRERARALLDAIMEVASVTAPRADDVKAWSKRRGTIEHEVRKAARLPMGRRIEDLDAEHLGEAWLRLGELRRDAESDAAARAKARAALKQRSLFDALPPEIQALTKLS